LVGKEVPQAQLKQEVSRCIKELKIFISIMYQTFSAFYGLEEMLK